MCLRNDRGTPIAGFRFRQIYQKICHLDNFFYVIQHGRRFVLLGMMANQQCVSELCIRYLFENILTPKKVCLSRLYNFTSRFGSVCHFQYHASIFELTFGIVDAPPRDGATFDWRQQKKEGQFEDPGLHSFSCIFISSSNFPQYFCVPMRITDVRF